MNGLRDHFIHAGYDAEELYFHELNQEKIEKLRVIWKGSPRGTSSEIRNRPESRDRPTLEAHLAAECRPERKRAA
jgi:hypothetical protein